MQQSRAAKQLPKWPTPKISWVQPSLSSCELDMSRAEWLRKICRNWWQEDSWRKHLKRGNRLIARYHTLLDPLSTLVGLEKLKIKCNEIVSCWLWKTRLVQYQSSSTNYFQYGLYASMYWSDGSRGRRNLFYSNHLKCLYNIWECWSMITRECLYNVWDSWSVIARKVCMYNVWDSWSVITRKVCATCETVNLWPT